MASIGFVRAVAFGLAAGIGLWGAGAARAALVLDLVSGGTAETCSSNCGNSTGATFGWRFTLTSPVTIDGLGIWDADANGIGASSPVGVWNASGTLLASATVTDASTPEASASVDGRWLVSDIPDLVLVPGGYRIGGVIYTSTPLLQTGTAFSTIAGVTDVAGVVSEFINVGFTYPDRPWSIPMIGPTMRVAAVEEVVPEPASMALLGLGLAGLAVARPMRRKDG